MLSVLLTFLMLLQPDASIYSFKVKDINGKTIDFSSYKGKKILIVNTASECGYTPQYADLEKLHKQYGKKVVVIGFPANNFGGQEPGTNQEIKSFCSKNYNVSFLMAEKVSVKGSDISPLFKWLIAQENPDFKGDIGWNFEKILLDENGKVIRRYKSKVKPLDAAITGAL
ncbi:MAG: glutathione peroxidase [Bacteroidetes bacterium]|jgi:glutathione peroxidase|nr:glutathione peroxidase [Bacteroidota bacterium]MBK9321123.1 glutathione peroxidase [Bacteroidota bacterium]